MKFILKITKNFLISLCMILITNLNALSAPQAYGTNQVFSPIAIPSINIGVNQVSNAQDFTSGLQILILLTILSLAPSILIMTTCFMRIVIVLSLARQAIGTASLPPTQVIVGLALILTFFVMAPTYNKINQEAIQPYMKNQITQPLALERSMKPIREYMIKYTDEKEIGLFLKMAKMEKPKNWESVPTYILLPAFILSELTVAFKIGFILFLPFLVIDIVIASILVSMGMIFLPPTVVATPFKLILFVMIDGWYLITKSLLEGLII